MRGWLWGLASLLAAATASPNAALAKYWQGGEGCERFDNGCDAALCNGHRAWGDSGSLDGYTPHRCEISADGLVAQHIFRRTVWGVIHLELPGVATLVCDETEHIGVDGCGPKPETPPSDEECARFGNPIDAVSGAKLQKFQDLKLSSNPLALRLERYYASQSYHNADEGSMLGPGWRTNFDATLKAVNASGDKPLILLFRLPNGRESAFIWAGGAYQPAIRLGTVYTQGDALNSDRVSYTPGEITLTTADETSYRFEVALQGYEWGRPIFNIRLAQISNTHGEDWTIAPETAGVSRVSDAFGNWIDLHIDPQTGMLARAEGSNGIELVYGYNSASMGAPGRPVDISHPEFVSTVTPETAHFHMLSGVGKAPISIGAQIGGPESLERDWEEYHYALSYAPRLLTSITNERGQTTARWEYDIDHRATASEHIAIGGAPTQRYEIEYGAPDANGARTRIITNPLGHRTVLTAEHEQVNGVPNARLRIARIDGEATASCPATAHALGYDAAGRPNGWSDALDAQDPASAISGAESQDARNLRLTRTRADGSPEALSAAYEWHPTLRKPTRVNTDALDVTLEYDAQGRVVSLSALDKIAPLDASGALYAPSLRRWDFSYTPAGMIASIDGPLPASNGASDVISYSYNASGTLAQATDALGHVTQITAHDASGRPTQIIDPNGVETQISYDFQGRITQIVEDAANAPRLTTITYDAIGLITTITDADGVALDFEYDAANRPITLRAPDGAEVRLTYNLAGDVIRTEIHEGANGASFRLEMLYDELSRLQETIGGAGDRRIWRRDALGRVASILDGLGAQTPTLGDGQTLINYDGLDRVAAMIDRTGAPRSFTYGPHAEPTNVQDANSHDTALIRNGFDEVVEERSPDRGTRLYYRDERGKVTLYVDAQGQQRAYAYNAKGGLLSITHPNTADVSEDVSLSYGAPGSGLDAAQITQITHHAGATSFTYDAHAEIASITREIEGQSYAYSLQRSASGKVSQRVYPSGRTLLYSYDAAGDLSAIETIAPGGGAASTVLNNIEWAPFGPMIGYARGAGPDHIATYDLSYRLVGQQDGPARHVGFTRDANGNILAEDDFLANQDRAYAYDAADRLTQSAGPEGAETFAYDALGARLSRSFAPASGAGVTEAYTYANNSNRLESISAGRSYAYNANGAIVSESHGANQLSYAYNRAGRLASVSIDAALAATYLYDHQGQIAVRTLYGPQGAVAEKLYTLHDEAGRRIAEIDALTNQTLREYLWLDDTPVAVIEDQTTLYWVQADHLNRPVSMTDAAGAQVWTARWTPFGEAILVSDQTRMSLNAPGQWFQLESGLHQNWMRDYDPTTGRYLQPDPLGLNGGMNLYSYANQNPLSFIDPTGETPVHLGATVLGGATGAGLNIIGQLLTTGCVDWGEVAGAALGGMLGGALGFWATGYKTASTEFSHALAARTFTNKYWDEFTNVLDSKQALEFVQWVGKKYVVPLGRKLDRRYNPWRSLNGNQVSPLMHSKTDIYRRLKGHDKEWKAKNMLAPEIAFIARTPAWLSAGIAFGNVGGDVARKQRGCLCR